MSGHPALRKSTLRRKHSLQVPVTTGGNNRCSIQHFFHHAVAGKPPVVRAQRVPKYRGPLYVLLLDPSKFGAESRQDRTMNWPHKDLHLIDDRSGAKVHKNGGKLDDLLRSCALLAPACGLKVKYNNMRYNASGRWCQRSAPETRACCAPLPGSSNGSPH